MDDHPERSGPPGSVQSDPSADPETCHLFHWWLHEIPMIWGTAVSQLQKLARQTAGEKVCGYKSLESPRLTKERIPLQQRVACRVDMELPPWRDDGDLRIFLARLMQ